MPTTVTVRAASVDASCSLEPSAAGYPVTASSGPAGGRPALSTYGVSAALPPWHVLGVEVVDRQIFQRRGGDGGVSLVQPAGGWRPF